MSVYYGKAEDLERKYAYIPDDAANAPARKKKKTVKKANHKHTYDKSIIINYFDKYAGKWTYAYRNVCTICGRIGDFVDNEGIIKKTFPHVKPSWFGFAVDFGYNDDKCFVEECPEEQKGGGKRGEKENEEMDFFLWNDDAFIFSWGNIKDKSRIKRFGPHN